MKKLVLVLGLCFFNLGLIQANSSDQKVFEDVVSIDKISCTYTFKRYRRTSSGFELEAHEWRRCSDNSVIIKYV